MVPLSDLLSLRQRPSLGNPLKEFWTLFLRGWHFPWRANETGLPLTLIPTRSLRAMATDHKFRRCVVVSRRARMLQCSEPTPFCRPHQHLDEVYSASQTMRLCERSYVPT